MKTHRALLVFSLALLGTAQASPPPFPSVDSPLNEIANGGFEAPRFSQGWNANGAVAPVRGEGGKGVAAFVGLGGRLDIHFRRPSQRFTLFYQFAVTQPPRNGRALTVDLRDGGPPLIRIIITAPGQLAVNTPDRLVYPFSNFDPIRWSIDSGGDGSFSAPGDQLNVYTLRIEYDGADEPYYRLALAEPGSRNFTRQTDKIYDFMNPVQTGQRMRSLFFLNVTDGASASLIDNVVLLQTE